MIYSIAVAVVMDVDKLLFMVEGRIFNAWQFEEVVIDAMTWSHLVLQNTSLVYYIYAVPLVMVSKQCSWYNIHRKSYGGEKFIQFIMPMKVYLSSNYILGILVYKLCTFTMIIIKCHILKVFKNL